MQISTTLACLLLPSLAFATPQEGIPTPPRYVYDPATGQSKELPPNLPGPTEIPSGSFTLEAFACPSAELQTKPRDFLPVFRTKGLQVGIFRNPPPHSYHWWQAHLDIGDRKPLTLARNRYRGISMVKGASPWRHLALVWNADTRTASFYLDYQLLQSANIETPPNWSESPVQIDQTNFQGRIVAPKLTPGPLDPWHFQRLTTSPLKDVSFAPETSPALPSDYGHVDVRLHYGAIGDGIHDDTEAIRRAFSENQNRVPIEYKTVYFPEGTYRITDSIRFSRFMVVRGAGADKTRIVLDDNAAGYSKPDTPKPAFVVGYDWPYVNRPKKNKAGNAIGSYIFDLTIDTGKGNPSALGLDFHCNNIGSVRNVNIISGDGAGMVGLDFKRAWPGPCLIKNVTIDGFDVGIEASHREYSLVFSDVRLKNQQIAAIRNNGNVLSLENLTTETSAPAIINRSGGLVTIINSELTGGSPEATAITSENASVYARNVKIEGYGQSLFDHRTEDKKKQTPAATLAEINAPTIDEYFTGPTLGANDAASEGSLKLPIKTAPTWTWPPSDRWASVLTYRDKVKNGDWSAAIQAAIDSGSELVYFPPGEKYAIGNDVVIRANVRTFFGASPKTKIDCPPTDDGSSAVFRFADTLEAFECNMLSLGRVHHDTPTTLIVRHCHIEELTADAGCGELFLEDAGGKWRFNEHQRVWGRQLNPETKGIPEIINDGGQLWVLGMKTEYLSTKIVNINGARTELLGGLMYPVHPVIDETLPMFINTDSDISLIHAVSAYRKNHKIYVQETIGDQTQDIKQWNWVSGRPIVNLYRSTREAQ